MSKCLLVKAVAALLFVLVFARTQGVRAGEVVEGDAFSSGTSFESLEVGAFDYRKTDEGLSSGIFFWSGSATDETAVVAAYLPGEAYDYAAHGLERNYYLSTSESEKTVLNYLQLNPELTLNRSVFSRLAQDESFTNVVVKTANRDSIYCDMLVQFTSVESTPPFDPDARISLWAEIGESSGAEPVTNLVVSAGCFTNGYTAAALAPFSCKLDFAVDFSRWYRLTIRAHGDVSARGSGLAGFSVYIDGQPVRAVADGYDGKVIDGVRSSRTWLSPEARSLLDDRRLFLGYAAPGSDNSVAISNLEFSGDGALDDISFSSSDPGYGKSQVVFTLKWDAGISLLKYTLDGGRTTNAAPVSTARSLDLAIGSAPTNGFRLAITDFAYDTAHGFKPGVWSCANGVTLTNDVEFVYDGTNRNPIAVVASTRECVTVGGEDGYDLFKTAFEALDKSTNAVKMLVLETNLVVSTKRNAEGKSDGGVVMATNPQGEYVLDLNGHTLRGSYNPKNKYPTLLVGCRSFRITDSSAEKTGRILPPVSHTDADAMLSASVCVYPSQTDPDTGALVRPLLTIESGIMDGWVRNDGLLLQREGTAVTGTVVIDGGDYISTNSATFYLESCVTNPALQFVYRQGYWSCLTTDAYVWSGAGADTRWTTPENWRGNAVPPAGKTALFPSRSAEEGPWPVDLGANGMTTTNLWLEGDVNLSGTNHFEDVRLTGGGLGRICGTATLVYEGVQPGKLTETILSSAWAGTVVLRAVTLETSKSPLVLRNIETWGTARSTVEFNGVRGYVRDTASRTMEYKLRLRDYVWTNPQGEVVTNAAWQNDSGYTGSTLAFHNSLLGDGTFRSGSNTRAIYQLYKFSDVSSFTGKLDIKGKRVLIGNDTVSEMKAGLIVFSRDVHVCLNLGWECRRAVFGDSINLYGDTNDVLVTCTDAQPDVTGCTNVALNGTTNIAWLAATAAKPWSVYVTGENPASAGGAASASSDAGSVDAGSSGSSGSTGTQGASAAALKAAALALATEAVDAATVSISVGSDAVTVTVSNTAPGLWYALRHRASLSEAWEDPTSWTQAEGTSVSITCPITGDSGFYGVVVSAEEPEREAEAEE